MDLEPNGELKEGILRRSWENMDISGLLSETGPARQPDFFCVGTEKAGTTWLWYCLRAHASVGVPATKELRLFNESNNFDLNHFRAAKEFFENPCGAPLHSNFLERVATELRLLYGGIPAYLRIFGQLHEQFVGELTPQYCIQPPERVQKMREIAPDARIIYLMRDPVERLVSGARMVMRNRQIQPTDSNCLREAIHPMQINLCNGHLHIDKFAKVFGEDKVGVFFYDDISSRPADLLHEICDFIGAERAIVAPSTLSKQINQGSSYRPSREVVTKLYTKMSPVYNALEKRFPERVATWRNKYE